jgi:hypothetical protein
MAQSITIEAIHPQFNFGGAKPTIATSAWFVTVDLPIGAGISFFGQVPFAYGKLKDARPPRKDETIGNPALGLKFHREHLTIEAMARLPIVENGFAGYVGALADIDRQEAFIPDIVALVGMIKTKIGSKFSVHPYGGISLNFRTEREPGKFFSRNYFRGIYKATENDGEMYLLYGGEAWLQIRKLHLGAAFNGRAWLSSGGNFDRSLIHQIGARAKLAFEHVSPVLLFRIPFDDIILDYTAGLNLEFKF